jgi:hypothetical protein
LFKPLLSPEPPGIMTMLGAAIAGSSFARSSTAGGNF